MNKAIKSLSSILYDYNFCSCDTEDLEVPGITAIR